jgi:glycosyltransferase involved in cell wall biosynthesis
MKNKFVVITTCYNIGQYIQMNVCMNKYQSYENVLFVYVDDGSTDSTYSILTNMCESDNRFIVLKNTNTGSQGKAFMYAVDYMESNELIHPDDIIVEVDGDDWLSSNFVLQYLNEIYQNSNIWMTYGQYQIWPSGETGGHYSMKIDSTVDRTNTHRRNQFPYSHLKTYKYHLFNKVDRSHLIDENTGEYFSAAWDHALCLPMVEMAGKNHIHRCDDILYILNRSDDLNNEGSARLSEQKEVESRIRNKPIVDKINRPKITFDLKGPGAPGGIHNYGLGNMMFQVATGLSLSRDNDATLLLPQLCDSKFGNYTDTVFNRIHTNVDGGHIFGNRYSQPDFTYTDIPYYENCIYSGYFQSEKFFAHNREYILNMFNSPSKHKSNCDKIYKDIKGEFKSTVSIHVRRGDYVNLPDSHPPLTDDYYINAIDYFDDSVLFLIFSDDIEWCTQNTVFTSLRNKVFISGYADDVDLILMSNCNHNIIANSTFSWWGAWLNEDVQKKVIAPSTWFGPKRNLNSNDIIPESWTKI